MNCPICGWFNNYNPLSIFAYECKRCRLGQYANMIVRIKGLENDEYREEIKKDKIRIFNAIENREVDELCKEVLSDDKNTN